jgi:EAL and modified HD-GYP domain-containing signal transduction protein
MTHPGRSLPAAVPLAPEVFLGRQPILDRSGKLAGYELLFRSAPQGGAVFPDAAKATATVIQRALGEFGLEQVLGGVRGFINFSADMLLDDVVEILPRDQIVIEILETVEPTAQLLERVQDLKRRGFSLALDDYHGKGSLTDPFLPAADIVKVDLNGKAPEKLMQLTLGLQNSRKKLLAEKVDSRRQADDCWDLGYDMFQGYFFARPIVMAGKKFSPAEQAILRLIGLVSTDAPGDEIEAAIRGTPQLAINLLRIVNSAAAGLNQPIQSLGHALIVLGRNQLRRWLQLLMYSLAGDGASHYPGPLATLAATRGKLLERLACLSGSRSAEAGDRAFMVGVLSLAGTLMSRELHEVIEPLRLAPEVKDALLGRAGPLGLLLNLAESLEAGDTAGVAGFLKDWPGKLEPETVGQSYVEAMVWSSALAA